MAHIHSVFDSNEHFVIDPVTREITNSLSKKIVVMQYDHNSERFTFEIPKQVDGHSMTACDKVEIHYINIDALDKSLKSTGVYESNDIRISPDDNSVAVFSWLLSRNCTKYAGTLNFLIHFACTTDGVEDYAWNTAIFQSITIGNGMNNGEEVLEPFPDILAQWKAQLFSASETAVLNVTTAEANALAAIEAAGEAKKQAVLDSIPDEYEALSAMVDQSHRNKAGAIVLNAEGESIVVNDASEYPLQNLKVFGKSTQDGTPTPDAPVDIVSVENPAVVVCGKNLFNVNAINTFSSVVNNGDGTITAKALVSQPKQTLKEICPFLKAGDIATFSFVSPAFDATSNTQSNYIYLISAKETWKNGQAKTITQKMLDGGIYFYSSKDANGNAVETVISEIQVELGEIATGYEPYIEAQTVETAHTISGIPVSSGGNYTDANGQQWICDEVDLARGVYVQRIGSKVFDGSDDEIWHSDSLVLENTIMFRMEISDSVNVGNVVGKDFLCTHFEVKNMYNSDTTGVQHTMRQFYFRLLKSVLNSEDLSGFRTLLADSPMTVSYALATPIETALSDAEITAFKALHSNRPNTTILNDSRAHMAVSYVADTKTYIDNKIAEMMKGVTE